MLLGYGTLQSLTKTEWKDISISAICKAGGKAFITPIGTQCSNYFQEIVNSWEYFIENPVIIKQVNVIVTSVEQCMMMTKADS